MQSEEATVICCGGGGPGWLFPEFLEGDGGIGSRKDLPHDLTLGCACFLADHDGVGPRAVNTKVAGVDDLALANGDRARTFQCADIVEQTTMVAACLKLQGSV